MKAGPAESPRKQKNDYPAAQNPFHDQPGASWQVKRTWSPGLRIEIWPAVRPAWRVPLRPFQSAWAHPRTLPQVRICT